MKAEARDWIRSHWTKAAKSITERRQVRPGRTISWTRSHGTLSPTRTSAASGSPSRPTPRRNAAPRRLLVRCAVQYSWLFPFPLCSLFSLDAVLLEVGCVQCELGFFSRELSSYLECGNFGWFALFCLGSTFLVMVCFVFLCSANSLA